MTYLGLGNFVLIECDLGNFINMSKPLKEYYQDFLKGNLSKNEIIYRVKRALYFCLPISYQLYLDERLGFGDILYSSMSHEKFYIRTCTGSIIEPDYSTLMNYPSVYKLIGSFKDDLGLRI